MNGEHNIITKLIKSIDPDKDDHSTHKLVYTILKQSSLFQLTDLNDIMSNVDPFSISSESKLLLSTLQQKISQAINELGNEDLKRNFLKTIEFLTQLQGNSTKSVLENESIFASKPSEDFLADIQDEQPSKVQFNAEKVKILAANFGKIEKTDHKKIINNPPVRTRPTISDSPLQSVVVKELVNTLLGFPSSLVKFSGDGILFCEVNDIENFKPNPKIDFVTYQAAMNVLKTSWILQFIEAEINCNEYKVNKIMSSMALGCEKIINDFKVEISAVAQLDNLSLLELNVLVENPGSKLYFLSLIVSDVKKFSGFEIVDRLFELSRSTHQITADLSKELLRFVVGPLDLILGKFLTSTKLDDPEKNFFIEQITSRKAVNPQYNSIKATANKILAESELAREFWQRNFILRRSNRTNFLSNEVKLNFLNIFKNLTFLSKFCNIDYMISPEILSEMNLLSPNIESCSQKTEKLLNEKLMEYLKNSSKAFDTFGFLKNYIFLTDEIFAENYIKNFNQFVGHPSKFLSTFARVYSNSIPKQYDFDFICLSEKLEKPSDLMLIFSPSFAENVFFDTETLISVAKINQTISSLRRLQFATLEQVSKIFEVDKFVESLNEQDFKPVLKIDFVINLFLQKVSFFVRVFSRNFYQNLNLFYEKLMTQVIDSKSLDTMIELFDKFIKETANYLFFKKDEKFLIQILEKVFDHTIKIQSLAEPVFRAVLSSKMIYNENTMQKYEVVELLNKELSTIKIDEMSKELIGMIEDLSYEFYSYIAEMMSELDETDELFYGLSVIVDEKID